MALNSYEKFNNPEDYYKGMDVCITGKIELLKGKPQIAITEESNH